VRRLAQGRAACGRRRARGGAGAGESTGGLTEAGRQRSGPRAPSWNVGATSARRAKHYLPLFHLPVVALQGALPTPERYVAEYNAKVAPHADEVYRYSQLETEGRFDAVYRRRELGPGVAKRDPLSSKWPGCRQTGPASLGGPVLPAGGSRAIQEPGAAATHERSPDHSVAAEVTMQRRRVAPGPRRLLVAARRRHASLTASQPTPEMLPRTAHP
jgi:hypothetical protein